jgi:predicted nucleotidyltransferase
VRFLTILKTRKGRPLNLEKLEPLIGEVCQKYGLSLFYLFGSYASAQTSKLSDLDVAVLGEQVLELDRLLDLTGELQQILEEEAVDLIDLRKAPLPLIHRVLKEGKCLYARDLRTKIENEMRWESLYFDTVPLRREHFESLKKRLKDGAFGCR